jgi:hypothetical protein
MSSVVEVVLPDAADFLAGLDPEQVDRLEVKLVARIDESYRELEEPEGERRAVAEQQFIEGIEEFVGELSQAQVQTLLEVARSIPDEHEATRRTDLHRTRQFLEGLRSSPGSAEAIEAVLREIWRDRFELIGSEQSADLRRSDQVRLILAVDAVLTEVQRTHAVAVMDRRIHRLERFLG